jgi:hypothetical protein
MLMWAGLGGDVPMVNARTSDSAGSVRFSRMVGFSARKTEAEAENRSSRKQKPKPKPKTEKTNISAQFGSARLGSVLVFR